MTLKFLKLFCAGSLWLTLLACRKDLLNTTNPNQVTESQFYKTSDDAVAATNNVYATLYRRDNYGWVYIWESVLTDDERWDGEGTPNLYGGLATGTETALGTNSYTRRVWNACYATIAAANIAINKIPAIEMDATLKNRLLAECKFFRALMYHRLVVRFGDVPLLLDLPENNPLQPHRNPKADVVKAILGDLDFATQNLAVSYSGSDIGRVKQGAADVLKARVNMFNGQWVDAAAAAKACLNLNYGLEPNYGDLFNKPGYKNSSESLFEVEWGDQNGNFGSQISTRYPGSAEAATVAPGGWGWGEALQNLVNEYENADGTPFVLGNRDVTTDLTQYQNRDPRFYQTIFYQGADFFGIPFDRTWTPTMYIWKKYTISNAALSAYPQGTIPYDWLVIRNAEAYLAYAEAQNEAVGPDGSVYNAVNAVRQRAGMPTLAAGLSQSDMRDKIHHERRVEFASESLRFEDLVRWKQLKSALENKNLGNPGISVVISNWETYRYLWPIPQQEIDLNPNLSQNLGY